MSFLRQIINSEIYFLFTDETPEISPTTSPSRSHSFSSPPSSLSSSPRSYHSHHASQISPPSAPPPHAPVTHYGLPPSISSTSHPPSSSLVARPPRTLAARKAYDEPLDVSLRRMEEFEKKLRWTFSVHNKKEKRVVYLDIMRL